MTFLVTASAPQGHRRTLSRERTSSKCLMQWSFRQVRLLACKMPITRVVRETVEKSTAQRKNEEEHDVRAMEYETLQAGKSAGLHAHRADDRRGDHRYPGGHRHPALRQRPGAGPHRQGPG